MIWTTSLLCIGGAVMVLTLNAASARGGLTGIRLALTTFFAGSATTLFCMVGSSLASSPVEVLPWALAVRAAVGAIAGGSIGLGFALAPGTSRWADRVTLVTSGVLAALGICLVLLFGRESLTQSQVSWIPMARSIRAFDGLSILAGAVAIGLGAAQRWRVSSQGRAAMVAVMAIQVVVGPTYLAFRAWASPTLTQYSAPLLIAVAGVGYWIALRRWRIAGLTNSGFALVFDHMPTLAAVVDLHTGACTLNPAAKRAVGEHLEADALLSVLGVGGEGDLEARLRSLADVPLAAVMLPNAPDRTFDVQCFYDERRAMGLIVMADVTERAAHAERLSATLSELRTTQNRLVQQEKLAALGVLVAGVNHEINNPLAWVSSNVRTLRQHAEAMSPGPALALRVLDGDVTAASELRAWAEHPDVRDACGDAVDAATDAEQGCLQIKEIVSSMRLLSRRQEEVHGADLAELVNSAVKVAATNLPPNVKLELDILSGLRVRCAQGELMRVVTNLVVNAGQAVGESGRIRVRVAQQEESAVIEVSDDGPGVPPELRQRIFDPFFTTKPVGKGTGLGLALSVESMRRHNGELILVDHRGPGATFQARLPLARPEEESDPRVPIIAV